MARTAGHWEDGDYANADEQDAADAESLYEILENKLSAIYDHDENYIRAVVATVKNPFARWRDVRHARMVKEYATEMYVPAALSSAPGDSD